ncbi:MAG: fasciclin domain-containing protein [Acidimicrobiales bacterium]|nr:fasciclin domain-containing protein [Acidimicrobiales bacterium]
MSRNRILRMLGMLFALTLFVAACGDDDDSDTASEDTAADDSSDTTEDTTDETTGDAEAPADSASICDTEALVNAVESGPDEGTLDGMTDDPVGTAASNNPVLTTLVTAVSEAGLVDTLNDAEALTVFAPTDCAFSNVPQETLDAALADPEGLLTSVLGFHVIAGEQLSAEDLAGMSELETFTGETLEISAEGDTVTVGGGQATVQVPDIQTANATVHLIDAVMLPPSAQ